MARKKVRVEILTKVFSNGYYAERGIDCLEKRGFDPKDFRIKLDFPERGDASLMARSFEADRMAWEEASRCLSDPLDDPLPKMEGRMRKKRRLSGALATEKNARGLCFARHKKRFAELEECLDAVERITGDVIEFGMSWPDTIEKGIRDCAGIKDLNRLTACQTAVEAVMRHSKGSAANLDGRRLGHITAAENWKIRTALTEAETRCRVSDTKRDRSTCLHAVAIVRSGLKSRGFKV